MTERGGILEDETRVNPGQPDRPDIDTEKEKARKREGALDLDVEQAKEENRQAQQETEPENVAERGEKLRDDARKRGEEARRQADVIGQIQRGQAEPEPPKTPEENVVDKVKTDAEFAGAVARLAEIFPTREEMDELARELSEASDITTIKDIIDQFVKENQQGQSGIAFQGTPTLYYGLFWREFTRPDEDPASPWTIVPVGQEQGPPYTTTRQLLLNVDIARHIANVT